VDHQVSASRREICAQVVVVREIAGCQKFDESQKPIRSRVFKQMLDYRERGS
jgi:hypothetical protein